MPFFRFLWKKRQMEGTSKSMLHIHSTSNRSGSIARIVFSSVSIDMATTPHPWALLIPALPI